MARSTHPDIQDDTISAELAQTCATEQVHLLGAVQPHGFMLVIDRSTLRIVQVSRGVVRHWPGLDTVRSLLDVPLSDWVEAITPAGNDLAGIIAAMLPTGSAVLPLRLRCTGIAGAGAGDTSTTWAGPWECLGHVCGEQAILEWQPGTDQQADVFDNGRLFAEITQSIARLRRADALDGFYDECVHVLQEFCGFDRVMIYRFLADDCGEVVAEHAANGYQQRFRGLRFPASDIPSQARKLYLTNRLRVLADVDAESDMLEPPRLPSGALLDQSHCILRGLSPVHLTYLRNMGVRATLTLSIVHGGRLWGLIACHHHQPRVPPHHVRESLRQVCELIAEVVNMRIEALSQLAAAQQRLAIDRLLNQLRESLVLGAAIPVVLRQRLPQLLDAFDATGFGFCIGQDLYFDGPTACSAPADAVIEEVAGRIDLHARRPKVLMWTDLLSASGRHLHTLPDAAGMLLAQRPEDEPAFCFFTRREVVRQIRWSGEPAKQPLHLPDGRVRLEPRRSFAEWQESIRGTSAPWEPLDVDALQTMLQTLCEVHKLQVNRALQEKLHWRSHHDQLTGLFNRRAMEDEVAKLLEGGQFNVALSLVDLHHFKKINDTYGHAIGDQVLQQLSQRLRAVIREFDLVARLGSDEFMLLLQIVRPDPTRAHAFAERLHEAASAPFHIDGQQLRIRISVGIAIPPDHGRTVGELLRRADLALIHAKGLGRSRSVVFEEAMESDQLDGYLLERDLNEAVEHNQLTLVYQPKVDLMRQRVVGVEALVRWHHPIRGLSLPDLFIPIAERSGQIVQIDRWVMRQAVAVHAQWRAQGLPALPIAINLSMADILSPNLLSFLSDLLQQHQVSADALEIEVTESCMMRDLQHTQDVLRSLNRHGISTTLDDFGTGFSSLSYLRQLPLQSIKIDRSFTQAMLQDANAGKLTQAILAMGAALGMRVIAEGVENAEQMRWLLLHGCHIGQGHFFSPPVAAEAVHETIKGIEERLARLPAADRCNGQIATQAPL